MKNGSDLIRDGIVDEIFVIKTFKSFHSEENMENNLTELIQSIATRISDLIENKPMLAEERKQAKKLRQRFTGQSGGEQAVNPETELQKAEKQIEEEVEKCAQKSDAPDPRYVGFSSEDYMREVEEKKVAQKFVGSFGKDDEQVEKEMQDQHDKKKKPIPKPPSKTKKLGLRAKLGIPDKKSPKKESKQEEGDFDFLGGSAKKNPNQTASNLEELDDLLDLNPQTSQPRKEKENSGHAQLDLGMPLDETDLIDFGNIPTTSNTGQKNVDIDLLVDFGGPQAQKGGNSGTGGMQIGGKMFKDINSDLFDLTGLNLGASNVNSTQQTTQPPMPQTHATGMSNGNPGYFSMENASNINGFETGKAKKKDLNINEFDFI